MGKGVRQRRETFFSQHPLCCFCGGNTLATEIDHIPARYLFKGRQWPKGYEFPACVECNRSSSSDELVMGFLARIQLQDMDVTDERELDQAICAVSDRHPNLVSGMRELSRIETRRLLRSQGLSTSSFPWEPYVVTMSKELMDVPHRYGTKLGKALYYMHTGRIVPLSGGVTVKAMTNAEFMSPRFPLERFQILTSRPVVARNGTSLDDQFSYRYAVPVEGGGAGFLVQFRQSTAMLILVYEDETAYQARKEDHRTREAHNKIAM